MNKKTHNTIGFAIIIGLIAVFAIWLVFTEPSAGAEPAPDPAVAELQEKISYLTDRETATSDEYKTWAEEVAMARQLVEYGEQHLRALNSTNNARRAERRILQRKIDFLAETGKK